MKLKYILTSFVMCLILIVSCTTPELEDHKEINVSQSIVGIPFEGGDASITLKTTTDWSIVILPNKKGEIEEWLTISKQSGAANPGGETITFSAEGAGSSREIFLNIVADGKIQYIHVKQTAAAGEIVFTPISEVLAAEDGKTFFVDAVITKIEDTLYGNIWLKDETGELYVYGTLDAYGQSKNFESLGLSVGDRITCSGPKSSYKDAPQLVNITVLSIEKSLLSVSPNYVEFPDQFAGEINVEVTCKKGSLDVQISEDWVNVGGIGVSGDKYTVTLAASANNTLLPREAVVTFGIKGDESITPVTVKLVQKGTAIFVDDFEAGLDQWKQVMVKGDRTWGKSSYDGNSYAQLSAYKTEVDIETWMVSPRMEIEEGLVFNFDSAYDYHNGDVVGVFITDEYFNGKEIDAADWKDITSSFTYPEEKRVFVNSGDFKLDTYAGKKVFIAFRYIGSPDVTTTQRVDNVYVGEPVAK